MRYFSCSWLKSCNYQDKSLGSRYYLKEVYHVGGRVDGAKYSSTTRMKVLRCELCGSSQIHLLEMISNSRAIILDPP